MLLARLVFFMSMSFLIYSSVEKIHDNSVYFKMKSTAYTPIESKKPIVVWEKYIFAICVICHSGRFLDQIPANSQSRPSPLVLVTKLRCFIPIPIC